MSILPAQVFKMRYIVILFFMLYCGGKASSQQIVVGVNGGYGFNTAPFSAKDTFGKVQGGADYIYGAKVVADAEKLQLGIGFDLSRYKYTNPQSAPTNGGWRWIGAVTSDVPLICPYILGNYKVSFQHAIMYFGLQIGYCMSDQKVISLSNGNVLKKIAHKNVACAGLQVGYRRSICKNWSAEIEGKVRYLRMNTSYTKFYFANESYEIPAKTGAFFFPFTVGVNYSFGGWK